MSRFDTAYKMKARKISLAGPSGPCAGEALVPFLFLRRRQEVGRIIPRFPLLVYLASYLWRYMLNNKPGRNAPKRSGGSPAPEKRKYGCGELQGNAGYLTVPVRVPPVTGSGMADRDSYDSETIHADRVVGGISGTMSFFVVIKNHARTFAWRV